MGYTHGRKWEDGDIEKDLLKIIDTLKLDHFPTKKEMIDFYGNRSLSNKVSKTGGSRYYAELLGMKVAQCESEFGNFYEEFAVDDIFEHTGFLSVHTEIKYPYDLLTNGNIKVDVKSSQKNYRKASAFPYYTFNLEKKQPTCDLYMLYCLDNDCFIERTIIVPSCIVAGNTQIGVGGLSKWEAYEDRWDYFNMYDNFYREIKGTEIRIKKRRSKG